MVTISLLDMASRSPYITPNKETMRIPDIVRTVPTVLKETKESVVLVGGPGIGKTNICQDIAAEMGADVHLIHPVYDEPVDYKGIPAPEMTTVQRDGEQQQVKVFKWLPPANLPLEEVIGANGNPILFVADDIGQAHPQVQNAMARCFHAAERVVAGRKLADRVHVIATTNRVEDMAAVFEMPSFARARTTFLNLDVDAGDWCSWAMTQHDVPEEFVSFLHPGGKLGGAKHIHDFDPARQTNCCPRTLHIAGKIWTALKGESPDVQDEYLKGVLCPAFSHEFRAHLRLYELLPDINLILAGKEINMAFCDRVDVLHLVLTSLTKRAEMKHTKPLAAFLNRLPSKRADLGVMFYLGMRKKLPAFASEKDTIAWVLAHRDLLKD